MEGRFRSWRGGFGRDWSLIGQCDLDTGFSLVVFLVLIICLMFECLLMITLHYRDDPAWAFGPPVMVVGNYILCRKTVSL